MNATPKTSIIINTYNRAKLLQERSLPSELQQLTSIPFEVIVVDDFSTDNTEEVVKKFQKKHGNLFYVKHEKNLGLAVSRNTGVKVARGEYIIFLDDDDFLVPYVAEIGATVLDNLPERTVVIGGRVVINPEGSQYQPSPELNAGSLYTTLDDGFIMRRSVFREIQYDADILTNEDADFGIQYMQKFGFESILPMNNCLLLKYGHQVGAASSWSSPSERTFIGMDRYIKKNLKFYEENYKKTKDSNELEYILRYMGRIYCQGGKMKEGVPYLWKAVRLRPMKKNILLFLAALVGHKFFKWFWVKAVKKARTKEI